MDRETLELVNTLLKLGIYNSRSEALRELIKIGIREFKYIVKVATAVEKLFELEREEGDIPIKLEGALKQLLEERGRF